MIRHWYIPNWSGDYRLEADGAHCKLSVSDPTPAELVVLGKFLKWARDKGHLDHTAGILSAGKSELVLNVDIVEAGKKLLGWSWRRKGTFTAVRSEGGKVEAIAGAEPEKETKALEKPAAAAAVTVRRPTLCCPDPMPGPEVRASEVLRAFCTATQWDDWERHGGLVAVGNLSGHQYRIMHRHTALARQQGKICWDLDDNHQVKAYDWSVPPAEEVLQVKLTLEHFEHWIRNPSGYFGPSTVWGDNDGLYRNPHMSAKDQGMDGIPDASFVRSFGAGMLAQVSGGASLGRINQWGNPIDGPIAKYSMPNPPLF